MTIPFDLPPKYLHDVRIFNLPSTVTNNQWHTWNKPLGISMVNILCIGGGGGGGGGFTAAAAAARGGGGGGGSSAVARVIIPAHAIPNTLYIQVGAGGIGVGSGGGTAGSGVNSYVCVFPNTTANNVLVIANNSGTLPAGGGTGTGVAVGAAGTAGGIAAIAGMPLAGMGQFALIAGQIGIAGGAVAGAIGPPQAFPTTGVITMGGPGGAGTTSADFAGGIITAVANTMLSQDMPIGPAAGSFDGSGGYLHPQLLFSYCGLGGSASNAGIGGQGGIGGPGSGGGGGGGGTTGGRGGDGGAGIVMITAW